MEKIDEIWEKAEQGIPKLGDTVIFRNVEDPGSGVTRSYEIFFMNYPLYTRAFPTVIRVVKRAS